MAECLNTGAEVELVEVEGGLRCPECGEIVDAETLETLST